MFLGISKKVKFNIFENGGNKMSAGGIVQGLSNLTTGIMDYANSKKQHKENMAFQREQFDWQKKQAEIQRQREDTAIQRRAQDLRQAGFNPYLAENDGAQASPVSGGGFAGDTTDQSLNIGDVSGIDPVNIVNAVYNTLRGKNQYKRERYDTIIKKHEAGRQIELDKQNELETEYKRLNNAKTNQEREQIKENIKLIKKRYEVLEHDLNISKREGLRTNDAKDSTYNSTVAAGNQLINTGKDILQQQDDNVIKRGERVGSGQDFKGQKLDEWEEGVHFNSHGEHLYEVYYDKRKKKLVKVWRDGKREYKD